METSARYTLIGLFTLAVIAAGLAFVYWLHTTGGFGRQAIYRVQFERTAGGLLVGSPVQFNGIKVGQVTALALDAKDPTRVEATIGIDANVPVRADTLVSIEAQGLTGSPAVALTGGAAGAERLAANAVLRADRGAGQSINQSAREVLQRIDGILSDNQEPLHRLIGNLETFAGALSRNSERVDGILAGLERMTGGAAKGPAAVFDLAVPAIARTAEDKLPAGILTVPEPSAPMALNSDKLMVRGPDGDLKPAQGAQWADAVPVLVQMRLVQAFESAGAGTVVMRPSDSVQATWRLLLDLRTFSAQSAPTPQAVAEVSARVVAEGGGAILAVRTFKATQPLGANEPAAVAGALDRAFADIARDLVPWALQAAAPKPPAPESKQAPAARPRPKEQQKSELPKSFPVPLP